MSDSVPAVSIQDSAEPFVRRCPTTGTQLVFLCEHASSYIPPEFENLGLSETDAHSHIAWDPGALALAERLAERSDGFLIAAKVSRLLYDCNRPQNAVDAIPAKSEIYEVPGNRNLTPVQRIDRVNLFYLPFRDAVQQTVRSLEHPIVITIHSFTPVYFGKKRDVEIGVLFDSDSRLGEAMAACAASHTPLNVQVNVPYGPLDGVTHSLKEYAIPMGHPNVMIEVRNDLIQTPVQQDKIASMLADWIEEALVSIGASAREGQRNA